MSSTPEHIIDIRLDPEDRWRDFGREHRSVIRELLARTEREAPTLVPVRAFKAAFKMLARLNSNHSYLRELQGLANAVGVGVEVLYLANVAYDFASVNHAYTNAIGCTSMVHSGPPAPMISRNMDWGFPSGVGEYSCLFRFVSDKGEYLSVGFPGVTGVVSAISSRGFALTVNQAPHESLPSFRSLPLLWLTRAAMDEGISFRTAKKIITSTRASTSAYILLAGNKPGEAARIISRGSSDDVSTVRAGKFAVVANHEPGEEEKYESEEGDSYHRFLELKRRGSNVAAHDVAAAKVALSRWPVFHRDTVHQMVMCPANGELHLKCAHRGERKYSLHTVG